MASQGSDQFTGSHSTGIPLSVVFGVYYEQKRMDGRAETAQESIDCEVSAAAAGGPASGAIRTSVLLA